MRILIFVIFFILICACKAQTPQNQQDVARPPSPATRTCRRWR